MLEVLWQDLESRTQLSGSKRLSEDGRDDFYAMIDDAGNRCLLLITDTVVDKLPAFSKIALTSRVRPDSKGSLTIKLLDNGLREEFTVVCKDLVECAATLEPTLVATGTLARLTSWRRLLEPSDTNLSLSELRGLVGELLLLERLAVSIGYASAVKAWQGPLGAAQDFTFNSSLTEVKTVYPSARTFSVSSVEQLDPPSRQNLSLVVVLLADSTPDNPSSFNVITLLERIHNFLSAANIPISELDYKVRIAGLCETKSYADAWFHLETMNIYNVEPDFPRVQAASIPQGVTRVHYDIAISACRPYEIGIGMEPWI